jgi:hypothetical protein
MTTTDKMRHQHERANPERAAEPDWEAINQRLELVAQQAKELTPPPCPSWCELPAGHQWFPAGSRIEDGVNRHHFHYPFPGVEDIAIEAFEKMEDGTLTIDEPLVRLDHDVLDAMEPGTACVLGEYLVGAASRCEQIRAGKYPAVSR